MSRASAFVSLVMLFAFSATLSAQGAFSLATGTGGTNGQSGIEFSITAINDVKIWRVGSKMLSGGSLPMEVWVRPGPITNNTTGWTRLGQPTTTNCTAGQVCQIPLDLNYEIRAGDEVAFVICSSAGNVNYTTGSNGTPVDANIEIDTAGYGGSYSASSGIGFQFSPRGFNGTVWYDLAGKKWDGGAGDGKWSSALNWDDNVVPGSNDGVVIPPRNEWENSNIPEVPANGVSIKGLRLDPTAEINMGPGTMTLTGDFDNAAGARMILNGGTIEFAGTEGQSIKTGGVNMGNVHISNTSDIVRLDDAWTNVQSGELTSLPGSTFLVGTTEADFSSNTGLMEGAVRFIGAGVTSTFTSSSNLVLGNCRISALDPADVMNFMGDFAFLDLFIEGDGMVDFAGAITEMIDFSSTLSTPLRIDGGATGSGIFTHDSDANITIGNPFTGGGLTAGEFIFASVASLQINGNFIVDGTALFNGDGTVTADAPGDFEATVVDARLATVTIAGASDIDTRASFSDAIDFTTNGLFNCPTIDFTAAGTVSLAGIANNTIATITGGGSFSTGPLTCESDEFVHDGPGDVSMTGLADIAEFRVSGSGNTDLTGGTLLGDVNLSSSGTVSIGGGAFGARVLGDIDDTSSGSIEFGDLVLSGPVRQTVFSDDDAGHTMGIITLSVTGSVGAELIGSYVLHGQNGALPILTVSTNSGLEVGKDTLITVDSIATEEMQIFGSFVATAQNTIERPRITSTQLGGYNIKAFNNSTISIIGIELDRLTGFYGLDMDPGSRLSALANTLISNANVQTAVIRFATDQLPQTFINFDIFANNSNMDNIDATAVSGVSVNILKGPATDSVPPGLGVSIYGAPFEFNGDPNDVLIWEDPPTLEISTTRNLPNALVSTSYNQQLVAVGGNRPYTWSAAALPDWLTLDPVTGILSGIPDLDDSGPSQFAVSLADASNPSNSVSKAFVLIVDELVSIPLQISTAELVPAEEGRPYSMALVAGGGAGIYSWNLVQGDLPDGVIFNTTGTIGGTAREGSVGTYPIRIRLTDSLNQTLERTYNFRVTSVQDSIVPVGRDASASSCSLSRDGSAFWGILLLVLGASVVFRRRVTS